MSCKWPEGKRASFAREKQSTCSHSAWATLFFQVFRAQTALSHVHQQILSAQPLKPCPETAYLFLTSWGKPLPSLIVSSYNHLRPPPTFPTTVYSQPGHHGDPVSHQQTLSRLSCTLHSPQEIFVCRLQLLPSHWLPLYPCPCALASGLCSLSDKLLP